ncbi:MmcQ/YjbR family DNA-binding protein [Anaerobium acetethylicum]|uniref:Predicted DNA-binding protein, MmcQ/YjbR family n=1 Tax=Anaerobium acetethylicum TaxID=1619234 RepID=A0A1D3TNB9_9FIRM|nr:MmcQ/YjbR family DNA-binding protein [Anaerobium acetethylicum]SCP94787.1 Predicted DNA-binding protein, MmcQ/YjbR family [Anaerobium acetethylicum]
MKSKQEIIEYCKTLPETYEDYPFDDETAVMRCRGNKKIFVLIFVRGDVLWINVKVDPEWAGFWRNAYDSVVPGYHMNKKHWNTIIMDGTVPWEEVKRMIAESYDLVKPRVKKPNFI